MNLIKFIFNINEKIPIFGARFLKEKNIKLIFSFKKILRKRKKILKNTNLMFGFRNKNTKENQI